MGNKINVAILFGGQSVEHEISLCSGVRVGSVIDKSRYAVHYIGIDKEGGWNFYDPLAPVVNADDPRSICLAEKGRPVDPFAIEGIDVVFPTLHGPLGEDGTVQGLLRLADIPFVGSDVLGSAVGMDKDIAKRLVDYAGLPTSRWVALRRGDPIDSGDLRLPLFVKSASLGSSIGVSKVHSPSELFASVEEAFKYDDKIILEEAITCREIQVAIIGNRDPDVSLPCEIIPKGEFHTYESKYIDEQGAQWLYPAPLSADEIQRARGDALKIFHLLCCEGFARIDFFFGNDGIFYFGEVNTIPGLTELSPYAKMWQSSGTSFSSIIDQLITLAIERHKARAERLITSCKALTSL